MPAALAGSLVLAAITGAQAKPRIADGPHQDVGEPGTRALSW
jgi:hypothetical protein